MPSASQLWGHQQATHCASFWDLYYTYLGFLTLKLQHAGLASSAARNRLGSSLAIPSSTQSLSDPEACCRSGMLECLTKAQEGTQTCQIQLALNAQNSLHRLQHTGPAWSAILKRPGPVKLGPRAAGKICKFPMPF